MYFNPALEIYVFDDQATIDSITGIIEHTNDKLGIIIAKIDGYLCCNLEISCERSPQDSNENYTTEKLDGNSHHIFGFGNYGGASANEIYNEFFGCDHKVVHQYQNKYILYKRVNSVLQIYISIEHFSQWDKIILVSFNPLTSKYGGCKCAFDISSAIKFHLGKILSTCTNSNINKKNEWDRHKNYRTCDIDKIIERARKHMAAFMPALPKPVVVPNHISTPHCDTDHKLLCPILLDHIKELSDYNHNQIIKRIVNNSTITDAGKIDMIKYLLD